MEKVRDSFGIASLVMVGDRGMISNVQIEAMRKMEGVDWITALKSGAIAKLANAGHGLRRWFDKRGELRGGGQRVSRHYYDLHQLAARPVGAAAIAETALGEDCVAHARMFFNRPDFDLTSAAPGLFALAPHDTMIEQLRVDYRAMRGMIFGDPPDFEAVLDSIASLETRLNEKGDTGSWSTR